MQGAAGRCSVRVCPCAVTCPGHLCVVPWQAGMASRRGTSRLLTYSYTSAGAVVGACHCCELARGSPNFLLPKFFGFLIIIIIIVIFIFLPGLCFCPGRGGSGHSETAKLTAFMGHSFQLLCSKHMYTSIELLLPGTKPQSYI